MQPLNRTKLCLYRLYLHPNAARCVAGLQKDQRRCLSMKLTKAGAARILCVSDRSSSEEVRSKFRALAFQHHPDITGGSSERFQEVYEAYRVLSGKGAGADERSMPMKSAEEVAVERLGKAVEEGDVEGGLEIWAYLVSAEGFVLEYFSVFPTVMRLVAMSENPRHGFRVIAEAEEKGYLPGEAYARCWNDFLDAVSLNDDMELSMEILNEMESRKLQPKIETVYKVFRIGREPRIGAKRLEEVQPAIEYLFSRVSLLDA